MQQEFPCDCAVGTPKKSYLVTFKTPKCWLSATNFRKEPDSHRQWFCNKWGSSQPSICPSGSSRDRESCTGIYEPLAALDHFSIPPHMNTPPLCNSKYRYLKSEYSPDPCSFAAIGAKQNNPSRFQGVPQLPKCYKPDPNPYGDTVCGLCDESSTVAKSPVEYCTNEGSRCGRPTFSCDLPFSVSLMDPNAGRKKKVVRPIGGVASCLHPSERHDLISIYTLEMLDFYKMKPRDKLELYRSPLTIDKRRKSVTIPRNPEQDLVLPHGEPICVNATPITWKSTKIIRGGKDFDVFIPNPIILEI